MENVAVKVEAEVGVVMTCDAAPPSDQEMNDQRLPEESVWLGALTESLAPSQELTVVGPVNVLPATVRYSPAGFVWKVTSTNFGRSSWLMVRVRPFESVAVSRISR